MNFEAYRLFVASHALEHLTGTTSTRDYSCLICYPAPYTVSAEFSNFQRIFYFSSGRFGFPAGKIIFGQIFSNFPRTFKSPVEYFAFPLEIGTSRWKIYFPTDVLNFREIFRISDGMGFGRKKWESNRFASVRFP